MQANNTNIKSAPKLILLLLALIAPSVIHADQDVQLECETSCSSDSFCGVDGVCRPLSCENFYEFGNRTFTGYDDNNPIPLECSPIPETNFRDFVPSLTYRCTNISLPDDDSPPSYVAQGYNRKCSAVNPTSSFECYSIDPSTDFSNFLRQTESFDCSPSNELPFFSYNAILEWDRPRESYVGFNQVHNMTYEFDLDSAFQGTIYSSFTLYPTESPTVSPSQAPSIDPPISGSVGTGITKRSFLALAGLAVILVV